MPLFNREQKREEKAARNAIKDLLAEFPERRAAIEEFFTGKEGLLGQEISGLQNLLGLRTAGETRFARSAFESQVADITQQFQEASFDISRGFENIGRQADVARSRTGGLDSGFITQREEQSERLLGQRTQDLRSRQRNTLADAFQGFQQSQFQIGQGVQEAQFGLEQRERGGLFDIGGQRQDALFDLTSQRGQLEEELTLLGGTIPGVPKETQLKSFESSFEF